MPYSSKTEKWLDKFDGTQYNPGLSHINKHWLCKKCDQKNSIDRKECLKCGGPGPKPVIPILKRPKASIRRKAFEKKHPELYPRI